MSCTSLLLFVALLLTTIPGLTQHVFEKGYFIDRADKKTECYILTEDWRSGSHLTFRKDYKEPAQSKPLAEISEISVSNAYKIIHTNTSLDISGDDPALLSYTQEPEWSQQDIFLWTLVDGDTKLYLYEYEGLKRYFYSTKNISIEQLVYKQYRTQKGVAVNDSFKQVLFKNVNCNRKAQEYFNALNYNEADLVNHFSLENKCANSNSYTYLKPFAKDSVNILPRLNSLNEIPSLPQVKSTSTYESTRTSPNVVRYFGLEVNQLLHQIINLNSNNNTTSSPYKIQYSSNSRNTGRGVSYGLAYGRNKFKDDSNGTVRETIDRSISFRIGYERKSNWGKRWIALHGYDLILGGTKLNTKSSQSGPLIEIENKSSFWGFGPRVGLMFSLSQRVFIGSEATYYLQFTKASQTISTGQPNSSQKSNDFSLTLPISLFLSVKMKE
ncbi:MAG: hypothetical protein JNM78_15995 [Cyclobacteriaceae bacterium]|nr:hypothetical protein [Cyclobacteriaceae bacterium]